MNIVNSLKMEDVMALQLYQFLITGCIYTHKTFNSFTELFTLACGNVHKKSLLTRNGYAFIQNDTVITYFLLLMGRRRLF